MSLTRTVQGVAIGWAVLAPLWLLTVVALAWGRIVLSREEIRTALVRTLGTSLLLVFPLAWAMLTYCAQFNPQPTTSAVAVGAFFAALLIPVYSALVACAAFEFAVQSAERRNAARRPLDVRILATVMITAIIMLGVSVLGAACFFAAGPRALG